MTLRAYTEIPYASDAAWQKRFYSSDCKVVNIWRGLRYDGRNATSVTLETNGDPIELIAAEDVDYFIDISKPYIELNKPREKTVEPSDTIIKHELNPAIYYLLIIMGIYALYAFLNIIQQPISHIRESFGSFPSLITSPVFHSLPENIFNDD